MNARKTHHKTARIGDIDILSRGGRNGCASAPVAAWLSDIQPYAPKPDADALGDFLADTCNAFHEANAADGFVFTQLYPVLRSVKK